MREYLMVYNSHDRDRASGKRTISTAFASPDGLQWTEVNADVNSGYIRVEILGPYFAPYRNFAGGDGTPIGRSDQTWHEVEWRDDLRTLWNQPIRLVFHLMQAHLYAFEFAP